MRLLQEEEKVLKRDLWRRETSRYPLLQLSERLFGIMKKRMKKTQIVRRKMTSIHPNIDKTKAINSHLIINDLHEVLFNGAKGRFFEIVSLEE